MVGILLSMSLIAMAPGVSAHYCSSTDGNCNQPCDDDGVDHDHYWRDSSGRYQECHSDASPTPPDELTVCDIYRLVYEIVDGYQFIDVRAGDIPAFELREFECNTPALTANAASAEVVFANEPATTLFV